MYVPTAFALTEDETVDALRRGGFAHLVTATAAGLLTTPLPMLYDEERHRLVGHVSRANPHWRGGNGGQSVAIFSGADGYVSPRWYPEDASRTRMAPTWNYEVLTVHGRLVVHDDVEWVRANVTALTAAHEQDRDEPWRIDEVAARDVDSMLRAIVGVEVVIERAVGKAKLSQNQPDRNRRAVIDGLERSASPGDRTLADRMRILPNEN
ncbi:Transcriptional regulator [Rhodococcus sp. RD6.2]|uniref:FMN-binding negative transcriptional regulator n=1 Tax=Rhodococcus sp. RD6.2 TaxID=260936 RepID=UPI00063B4213|nr:FMN-binding negative transcriptional regulator [Rhodococcus sp. RD6.2]CRK51295.1 Transcriptional regulator [Rhodococcus sp. RD6.2]